jgi:RNA polymerase sigma factor (sigma-70 family)
MTCGPSEFYLLYFICFKGICPRRRALRSQIKAAAEDLAAQQRVDRQLAKETVNAVTASIASAAPPPPTSRDFVKAGADDFLTKPVKSNDLLRAIERAFAHYEAARGLKSKLDIVRAHIAALTPRERQVFELVIRGNTNKQVARAIGGTERTIKAHRHRVMEKMQVRSVAELVSLAERFGVLGGASGNGQSA